MNKVLAAESSFYNFHARSGCGVAEHLHTWRQIANRSYKPFLHHVTKSKSIRSSTLRVGTVTRLPATLNAGQVQALVEGCDRLRDRFLLMLLHETGMRIGQALGLRHGDIRSWDRVVRIVPRDDNANGARAKTRTEHDIPVSGQLTAMYSDYMHAEYGELDSDYVFVNLWDGARGQAMTYSAVDGLVRRLRRRCGIEFHQHQFRHTHATEMLRAGVRLDVVSERLGHSSIQTTQHTYAHLDAEDLRREMGPLLGGAAVSSAELVADETGASYRDRLMAAVRAPFAIDVLTPGPNHPTLCERSAGTCTVAGCGRAARPSGLCFGHHRRWTAGSLTVDDYAAGAAALRTVGVTGERRCEVTVCGNGATDGGLCRPHHDRWKRADRPPCGAWTASAPAVERISDCEVTGCSRPCASARLKLCDSHTRTFRSSSMPPAEFTANAAVLRDHRATYDFGGLPPLIGLELRYAVQSRCDDTNARMAPADFAGVAAVLRDHATRSESLLSRPLTHWEQLARLPGRPGDAHLRVSLIRYAHDTLTRFAADDTDDWAKEVWDLRRLGLYTPATGRVLRFDDTSHPWPRTTIKQWCRQRLARFKISTVSKDLLRLRQFARFLTERHPGIASGGLGRPQILGFIDWTRSLNATPKTKSRLLSVLRCS